ncbi:MAG: ABC transporter permease [Planctomycetes bacterium]|nr:ABC transporter permease [Planctomycetota bacterium]
MTWIALKMLTGERSKYFGIVFGVMFASLLIAHQVSIFIGIMARTTSQIRDVQQADIWVMDPNVRYMDETTGLSDTDLQRVRGVEGIDWAVKFYKGNVRARLAEGGSGTADFRNVIMLGLDDDSMIGAPREIVMGKLTDLKQPDAVVIDEAGFNYLWPNQPHRIGMELEMNDHRAVVVGICKASPPFQSMGIVYTLYSRAMNYAPPERRLMSFILAKPQDGVANAELCRRIHEGTGLKAQTSEQFAWSTINFYLANTGIPVNFGITVLLGFIVGVAIAGQTFYLFTIENLKQFGALKAMGTSNLRIVGMILTQALVVGVLGYGIGMGLAALFFEGTKNVPALLGFHLYWEVMAGAAVAVLFIIVLASLLSIHRVLVLEPAIVFR